MSKLTFEGARHKQGTESVAFPVLFQLLAAEKDANISRLDIACDDREDYLRACFIPRSAPAVPEFWCQARRKNAGILCVFQDFPTRHDAKRQMQTVRREI